MTGMEIFYNVLIITVFYLLGGISVAMLLGMIFPQYVPWAGLLAAVIYAFIMTLIMGAMGTYIAGGKQQCPP